MIIDNITAKKIIKLQIILDGFNLIDPKKSDCY